MTNDDAKRLAEIRERTNRMERDHECPHDPKRAKWCEREPCGTMTTVIQLRNLANEVEFLREQLVVKDAEIERANDMIRLLQSHASSLQQQLNKANAALLTMPAPYTITLNHASGANAEDER